MAATGDEVRDAFLDEQIRNVVQPSASRSVQDRGDLSRGYGSSRELEDRRVPLLSFLTAVFTN